MGEQTAPPRAGSRTPLTRERVVQAAITLADDQGLESLTMRNLGEALGVKAMSLYNHVTNKDDLLDGMVDTIFREVELPSEERGWRRSMRQRALSLRSVLARHPWASSLMDSRSAPGPATLRHHDAVLGCLRGAGFSLELTAHAYAVLDSYVYGFAHQEHSLPADTPGEFAQLAQAMVARIPADDYPHLAEFTVDHVMKPGYDFSAEYEFGLDLILDGLDRAYRAS